MQRVPSTRICDAAGACGEWTFPAERSLLARRRTQPRTPAPRPVGLSSLLLPTLRTRFPHQFPAAAFKARAPLWCCPYRPEPFPQDHSPLRDTQREPGLHQDQDAEGVLVAQALGRVGEPRCLAYCRCNVLHPKRG